jgi:hypothetical protein
MWFWRSSPRRFARKPGENNLDSSASERALSEYLRSTGGVILSYAECLTTSRKCLILWAFESFEAVRFWW